MTPPYYVHPSAYTDAPCTIGAGTKIWHFCHVMAGARIGERGILGQNVQVAPNVGIGNNVKMQNNVSVYTGVELEDDVFGWRYQEVAPAMLRCLDWPEDRSLP